MSQKSNNILKSEFRYENDPKINKFIKKPFLEFFLDMI